MQTKKIMLVAINSRFNHVSLAIRSLESYIHKYSCENSKVVQTTNKCATGEEKVNKYSTFVLQTKYFTINQPILDILSGIALEEPDAVFFSVYIWNAQIVKQVACELKKVLKNCIIGAGGPEVSYDVEQILEKDKFYDLIMAGEGERTALELCQTIGNLKNPENSEESLNLEDSLNPENSEESLNLEDSMNPTNTIVEVLKELTGVKGLYLRIEDKIIFTGVRPLIENLDEIPFPYNDGNNHLVLGVDSENSIIYYESSRGCPFHCSYCLSSVDKSVRFRSLSKVTQELAFFMDNNVRLVKFVDRTYNLNEERYIAIWNFIQQNWNGKTTFHFEIAAQQLTDKALDAIQNVPYGCMQFEIGIQSTNQKTLDQVGRSADFNQVSKVLERIPKTIHVHLDLIAGLPYETLQEFTESFNYTITRKPQMLQLGFLKILHGTSMEEYAYNDLKYTWMSQPPYQVLSSPWVSYREMEYLKKIENLVDNYYNSQNFIQSMSYIILHKKNCFAFFELLVSFFEKQNLFDLPHKSDAYYNYLYDFLNDYEQNVILVSKAESVYFSKEDCFILRELLRFDYTSRTKPGVYPSWYERVYDKDAHRKALEQYYDMHSTRDAYVSSSYETFKINPFTFSILQTPEKCSVLFFYNGRHLTGAASKTAIRSGECLCIECK